MKRTFLIAFSVLALILPTTFAAGSVTWDPSFSANAQQSVEKKRNPGIGRTAYGGGKWVTIRTYRGGRWVTRKVWRSGKWAGRKSWKTGRKVVSRSKKVIY